MPNVPTAFILTHQSDPAQRQKGLSLIALSVTRSLGRRGVRVVRVHPNRMDYGTSSIYCSKLEVCPDFYASETALVQFLLEMVQRYDGPRVLIPASDDCAAFLATHHEQLRSAYRIVGPTREVMNRIADKRSQYETAQRLGIAIPETYFPAGLADLERLVGVLQHYPYVIKPLVSHKWRLASSKRVLGVKKAFVANNAAELLELYRKCARVDPGLMVQEVIGGRDERLLTFLSCFNERSEPLAYCIRKKIRQSPIDFGYCTYTVSCHHPEVEAQSLKLLKCVGFHGICGVEWKLDPKTGLLKLIEINARAVNTIGIGAGCGVDIPYLAFRDALGDEVRPVTDWKDEVGWLWLSQDVWAARSLWRLGGLTLNGWRKSLARKNVYAVYANDDLTPFLHSVHAWSMELGRSVLKGVQRRAIPGWAPATAR